MPILLTAIILGLVEGITEFLPVSSTGHLLVAERLIDFKDTKDLFTVIIQLGAILAVIWFYRVDLYARIVGLFQRQAAALQFWKILIIATIPAGLIGLGIESHLDSLSTPLVIAVALIVGGIILLFVDRAPIVYRRQTETIDFSKLSKKQALLIGFGQSVAIVPGVSRSGATIVSGLASGLNRPTATAFSFYLSIPILLLASGLKAVKYAADIPRLPGGLGALLLATIVAFITAFAAISWLLRYVSHHNFQPFAWYRITVGFVILLLLGLHVI